MDVVFDPAPTGSYIPTNGSGSNAEGSLIGAGGSFTTVSGVLLSDATTSGRVGNASGTYYQVAPNGAHVGVSTIECIVQFTNSTGNLADLAAYTQFDDNLFMLGNYSDKTFISIKSSDGALHTLIADSTASSTYTDGNGFKYREVDSTAAGVVEPNKWHVITITFESPGAHGNNTFESPGAHGNNTLETVKTYVDGSLVMTADISSDDSSTWYILLHREPYDHPDLNLHKQLVIRKYLLQPQLNGLRCEGFSHPEHDKHPVRVRRRHLGRATCTTARSMSSVEMVQRRVGISSSHMQ